jgi:glycosyltransferase involved in cell wall biosynthesis
MEGLSIIIPTLNEEKYVGKLLDCLVKQTYKNFEVIVVDGHSDDKTKKVVNNFNKRLNLKLIDSKKRNISYQRNIATKKAEYENLLFIDADVIFERNLLAKMMVDIEKNNLAIAGIKTNLKKGNLWEKMFFYSINFVFKNISYLKPYSLGAFIYCKKEIHKKINGFPELFAENFAYITKAKKFGKFGYLSKYAIYTSPRRFKKYGTRNTIKIWLNSFFYNLFTNRHLRVNYPYDR